MKNPAPLPLALVLCTLSLAACRQDPLTGADGDQVEPIANTVEADDYDLDPSGGTFIQLDGGSIVASGGGVEVAGTTATITRAGTYTVRGQLANGQIRIKAASTDKVKLVLDGVSIQTADDAPIFVKNASKLVIYLAPGSTNTLTDGAASTRDGAIHCKTRLSIFGPGTLNVTGNVDDGINAEGGIIIEDGVFNVQSLESGIKSDINLVVNGGTFTINAGNDGMHSETTLDITGGDITVVRCWEGIESAAITISGGTIHVAASDDGINASSGGGGDMGPGGGGGPGGPGMPPGGETGTNTLVVQGGYVYVDADGDGLDVNGPVQMVGGTIIVNGPTANNNGALDYTGRFAVDCGYLLAVGSSGMAQMPSSDSSCNSVMLRFATTQQAGTLVHITRDGETDVLTFRPTKRYQNVVFASSLLTADGSYAVYVGGSSTGAETDGLFTGGVYYGGSQRATFSLAGLRTAVNVY